MQGQPRFLSRALCCHAVYPQYHDAPVHYHLDQGTILAILMLCPDVGHKMIHCMGCDAMLMRRGHVHILDKMDDLMNKWEQCAHRAWDVRQCGGDIENTSTSQPRQCLASPAGSEDFPTGSTGALGSLVMRVAW